MKNKLFTPISLALLGLMIIVLVICSSDVLAAELPRFSADSTQVLVVGTIHGNHEINPNYSYQDLLNILATYKPDAICVEIRPEDFRRRSYLKEMMMATIFGIDRGIKVYPIDWWGSGDDRTKQADYMKTPEYKANEKKEEVMVVANEVMQEFPAPQFGTPPIRDRLGGLSSFRLQKGRHPIRKDTGSVERDSGRSTVCLVLEKL